MGIPLTLKMKRMQTPAPGRLVDDRGSSTNTVPVSERRLTRIEKVRIPKKFFADAKSAGLDFPLRRWLRDYKENGFHPGLITRAEEMFKGHPDLLVTFKTFFPKSGKCGKCSKCRPE